LYANGDIYLLDDPISAVDAKVAKEIYEKVILPLSKEKTLILVTHQINYLFECDHVLILEHGEIRHHDSPKNLMKELKELSLTENKKDENEDEE
jgi:ATP-binding cassette subfamily C (CFTR/MRP) protein 4